MKLPPKITNAKNKKPLPTRKFKNTLGHLLGQRGNKPKSQMIQGRGRKLIDTRNIAIYSNFKWTVICKNIETTQECKLGVAGKYRRFWKLSGSPGLFFYLTQ